MSSHGRHAVGPATLFVFAMSVAGLAACGGGKTVTLPAVEPNQVQIFMPGQRPTEDYKPLKNIDITVDLNVSNEELLTQAVQQAAAVGADALVVDKMGSNVSGTTGAVMSSGGAQQVKRQLQGRAIYYPAKHPELEEGNG
jgi:ABC-type glycerol-3-phosphate transport system substrate-binding protein